MLEFLFDTTRAVVEPRAQRHGRRAIPDIELIVPHAGATLPMIADRVAAFALLLGVDPSVDVLRDLGRLHFDLAGFPIPRQLDALLDAHDARPPALRQRLSRSPPSSSRRSRPSASTRPGEPPGSLLDALRANTERLFPALGAAER